MTFLRWYLGHMPAMGGIQLILHVQKVLDGVGWIGM